MSILYYLNRCPHSKQLMNWIKTNSIDIEDCKMIDLRSQNAPLHISAVPTLCTQCGMYIGFDQITRFISSKIDHVDQGEVRPDPNIDKQSTKSSENDDNIDDKFEALKKMHGI